MRKSRLYKIKMKRLIFDQTMPMFPTKPEPFRGRDIRQIRCCGTEVLIYLRPAA
jgi:hypothetical protein